ncbi:unnamed protein product [Rotaria sp. Silwood2]|nr:unnamed protein product [Rotaria sp. Silwood2]CAF2721456.1 unnamed protein product [Rotaria sp. Silwood2]CAF2984962.1 unnamed protein product [Rotaria sp. Silwood2]CAF3141102.1 unnamed protein product [Rotaria sp. Silwood2]CAF3982446.1 unnamed protein product [Rotaria sp. Silwood2]
MPLVFREIHGDLFSASSNTSLAHCVSRDMNVPVGGCAYITADDRCIFNLVTKERYYYKPTMATLESSLRVMRDLCIENKIHHLAMPRIGCGLDKLNWNEVSKLIQDIFKEDDIEIMIYTI